MTTRPTAEPQVRVELNSEIQREFWLRHMRIGFGVFLGETLFIMAYLGFTPEGPHRLILWTILGSWIAVGVVSLLLAPLLASRHWRARFSAVWTIFSVFAVAFVASLDGGFDSPVIFLFFLPLAYVALAFAPRTAGLCGLTTLVCAALVVITDANVQFSKEGVLVFFGVLSGASVVSVTAAVNRTKREEHERSLSEQVSVLAATDGLTGCAVHRVFWERFEEEVHRSLRHSHALSFLLIDVDEFKSVNDTYGHLVGDHVLAGVGAALRAQVRTFDLVGRLGGDEFGVLMPDTEPGAAVALAQRIRRDALGGLEVPVTLSIGVSGLDPSIPSTEHMLDDADFALYQVKRAGRDGVASRSCGPWTPNDQPRAAQVPSR